MKKFNVILISFIFAVLFSSCYSNNIENGILSTSAKSVSIVESTAKTTTIKTNRITYVKSIHSSKFHFKDCFWVQRILDKNKVYSKNRNQFIESGYSPCEECRP